MNDQEFKMRAQTAPYDESADFLTAANSTPERQQILAELQLADDKLKTIINSVSASEALRLRLLEPESLSLSKRAESNQITPAANDSTYWKKIVSIAASFLVAIGIAISYPSTSLSETDQALQQEIFAHVYFEIDVIEDKNNISVEQVNQMLLASIKGQLQQNLDITNIKINKADYCWIDNTMGIHLVLDSDQGLVTALIIPNTPVEGEFNIADERFEGIISPIPTGNLVVLAERPELAMEYHNIIASNMAW